MVQIEQKIILFDEKLLLLQNLNRNKNVTYPSVSKFN